MSSGPPHIESSSALFELPKGWRLRPLREVTKPSSAKVDPAACPTSPYLSLEHIEAGTTRIIGSGLGSDVKSTKAVFNAGDVLYGKLRPYLNKVTIPDFDGIASTDILVFPPVEGLDQRYLLRFLSSAAVVEHAHHHSIGLQMPRTSFEVLGAIEIPLPPLDEQRRIAQTLEELTTRVRAARTRLEIVQLILTRFRQAVLSSACSGALTADWRLLHASVPDDQAGRYPATWTKATIGDVADVRLGGTPSRKNPELWNGSIPWISSGEVAYAPIHSSRETISRRGLENSNAKVYPPGTVLIAMIGEGKTRGQSAILRIEAATNQNVAGLVVDRSKVTSEFVWMWAQERYERSRSDGSGGVQPALNAQKVRAMEIVVPPIEEQKEIVRRSLALVDMADRVEDRIRQVVPEVDRMSQAILAKVFRGDLTTEVPES